MIFPGHLLDNRQVLIDPPKPLPIITASYSKLIPQNTQDHASYFSFYDVAFKVAVVMGTFSYGLVEQITGSMRISALVLTVFFLLGLYFLVKVKFKENVVI